MFNIFNNEKPFQDNDKWLTRYYWIVTIFLFLGLAAGVVAGLVMFFFAPWWQALLTIGATILTFWIAYIGHMVLVGFLVDIKTIRNKIYSLENNNKEFYDDESEVKISKEEVKISKETEELYRSPKEEKYRKEQQGMSKSLKIALVAICLLVLVGVIIGGIIIS